MGALTVVVTGGGGLLAGEVARAVRAAGGEATLVTRETLDVTDREAVFDAIGSARPTAVVHCAAMTNVDACEQDPERASEVNAQGAANVAAAAARVGAEIVAVSTDYVFDGAKGAPYLESDATAPIQEYGRSKLGGERFVRELNPRHYVVRSAWIYGAGGKNFLSRLFEVAAAGTVSAVRDQTGSPTYAPDLAGAIVAMIGSRTYGTYHVVNGGAISFAEFCSEALAIAGITADVREVSRRDLDRPAARPEDTSLAGAAYAAAGFPALRDWRAAAADFVAAALGSPRGTGRG